MITIPAVREAGFEASVVEGAESPLVRLSGNADAAAIAPLGRFIKQLHQEACAAASERVSVDLGQLYFMNSSCLKALVSWVHSADTGEHRYRIRLLSNPRQHWQRRSLATLQRLAPSIVEIEELTSRAPRNAP